VSIDTLRLLRPEQLSEYELARNPRKKQKKIVWTDEICAKFKHIAVDESQKIKNDQSSRTKALRTIAKLANDGKKARVICYSGTNIEKHSGEFFVTLNLVRPEIFPIKAQYLMQHCRVDMNGKIGGLRNATRFRELTKDFIIRYKREEVLPDLPKVFRQFHLADLQGDELQAYIRIVKAFKKDSEDPKVNMSQTDILGYLTRMRHITGIAKVDAAVDFIGEFLEESDRKIVIFLHHIEAGAILNAKLNALIDEMNAGTADGEKGQPRTGEDVINPVLYLAGGLKMGEGSAIIEEFRKPGNRILIASTLAAGEGYNMQFCSDCLFMERQWNPSAEEQCEGRFPRPRPEDPWPVGFKINAHYLIAAGTIDDFLTDIVEVKRANVANTLDGEEILWDEKSLHAQLAAALREKGLLKWGLR
jgi:SNF2 family DNA or RNA helicase